VKEKRREEKRRRRPCYQKRIELMDFFASTLQPGEDLIQLPTPFNFVKNEYAVLKNYWENKEGENEILKLLLEKNKDGELFDSMDGPPFVSSDKLHWGHIFVSSCKSEVQFFQYMNGKNVFNRLGYDTHGLPIEMKVNEMFEPSVKTKQDVEELGIAVYNQKCKDVIASYSGAWAPIFRRMARWSDPTNEYKTMDTPFMETCWWAFKKLWQSDLVEIGFKVMPYSTGCCTALSNFEAGENYKEIDDSSVFVKFRALGEDNPWAPTKTGSGEVGWEEPVFYVAWTTTPWTLPSNLALCVNKKMVYVLLRDNDRKKGELFVMAKETLGNLYPQRKKKKGKGNSGQTQTTTPEPLYIILDEFLGVCIVGQEYEPLLEYFMGKESTKLSNGKMFRIISDPFVDSVSGTGIVHCAPAFGEDDCRVCVATEVVALKDVGFFCPVDDAGRFTEKIHDFIGKHVLDCNDAIARKIKDKGHLIKKQTYRHSYPHCWRTDGPLIYRAVSSFFIKVTLTLTLNLQGDTGSLTLTPKVPKIKDQLVANNDKINWTPEHIGSGRFKQWISNPRDWNVSRSRFFGTPIPVWVSYHPDGSIDEKICVGSIQELTELADLSESVTDLHRETIDSITIKSKATGNTLTRVEEVFDCWYESGCVPYAQKHYPFENNEDIFDGEDFLSEFVCEGVDQTRGWFYTLNVLSTALFDRPAFKNVICSGMILADDGKKFCKKEENFTPPLIIFDMYGADACRLYLSSSPAARGESFKFSESDIKQVQGKMFQFFNGYKFLIENMIKFGKDGHPFDVEAYKKTDNVMDKWVLSCVGTLVATFRGSMESFVLSKILENFQDFVEDITNWYIKFNRNRIKGRNNTVEDHGMALSTLYRVLLSSTKIFAPFMPFLMETLYQHLQPALAENKRTKSVLLCDFPVVADYESDIQVERKMNRLQKVANIIRALRSGTKATKFGHTTIKLPIKKVTVSHKEESFAQDIDELQLYFKEEINALSFEYPPFGDQVTYKLEPNNRAIGTQFRGKSREIVQKIKALSFPGSHDIENLKNSLTIEIDGREVTLNNADNDPDKSRYYTVGINLGFEPTEHEDAVVKDGILVVVDFTRDLQVNSSYWARLFVTRVQQLRKKTKLRPWNQINIYYSQAKGEGKGEGEQLTLLEKVLHERKDQIATDLGYPIFPEVEFKWEEGSFLNKTILEEEVVLDGMKVHITITDATGEYLKAQEEQ